MVDQILPNANSFLNGSTELADAPQLYSAVVPWSGTVTAWNIACEDGAIGDRDGGATFAPTTLAATERKLGWFVWDQIEQDDGSAKVYPGLNVISGAPTIDTFCGMGVCARVQNGTWTPTGDAEGYLDVPDGYYFIHSHKVGSGDRLFLIKMYGGAAFQLSTRLMAVKPGGVYVPPKPMRIECEGRTIRCFREADTGVSDYSDIPFGITEEVDPPDPENLIFAVVDNSATAILDPGRYGFGIAQPLSESGLVTTTVATQFDLKNASGEVVVRDLFQRAYPAATKRIIDGLGRGMQSVMSAFTGDYHGCQTNPPYFRNLLQDTANRVYRGPDVNWNAAPANQQYGWHISQRPADSSDQARILHFHFANIDASNNRTAAVLLRGNFTGTAPPLQWDATSSGKTGYQFEVSWAQGGSPQFTISIVDLDGLSSGPQAIATASLPGIALGTDHILEVSVEESPAKLRAVFNGTPVSSWVVPPGLLGVTAFGEYVTDSRTAQHATGGLEGFFFRAQSYNASPLVWFSYWGPGDPVGDSGGIDPSSYATFPVPLENYNASSDVFNMDQGWPASVEDQKTTIVQPTRSGHKFRISGGARFRRRWPVSLTGRSKAELDYVEAFILGKRGGEIPFRWIEQESGESVLVRFKGGSMDALRKVRGGQAASLELEEVFEYA